MEKIIEEFLGKILSFLKVEDYRLNIFAEEEEIIRINIWSESGGFLIGSNGENLKELEYLLKIFLQQKNFSKKIILDINNYRKNREEKLKELARNLAHQVSLTKKEIKLPPMNAYERRIIHLELATNPNVITESVGEEPNRHLIIKPYP